MTKFLGIARTGVTAVLLYPVRSVVTIACVLAVLCPHLAGLGISRGVQAEAEASVRSGADLYVAGLQFGLRVPIPLALQPAIEKIDGVVKVVPRIVGSIDIGKNREHAVLVGLPEGHFPITVACVEGRLPQHSELNEFVVGVDLARRLKLEVGSMIPPFYKNAKGERLSQVVGLFRADTTLWQANLILTSLESAAAIFDQDGLATDFLVACRPGYENHVAGQILQTISYGQGPTKVRPLVTRRQDLEVLLPQGLLHREGIFNLHFTLLFAVAILVVLVTSGLGLPERRREIGILKATGWQTDEILFRSFVESLLLSLASSALAILLSFVWLKWFNGYWIASVFLAGMDAAPGFQVPFRLTPVPVLITTALALVLVMTGTLYSSWRAATVPPMAAMR